MSSYSYWHLTRPHDIAARRPGKVQHMVTRAVFQNSRGPHTTTRQPSSWKSLPVKCLHIIDEAPTGLSQHGIFALRSAWGKLVIRCSLVYRSLVPINDQLHLSRFYSFRFCRPKVALMNCAPFFPTYHMSCNSAAQNSLVFMVNGVIEPLLSIEKP